ncbi:unnamed protein product [Linum trigynum]|uniref:Uncharacterized protein n=1 Tax=Linum trigynum TaxID=586398 RepID=A0AAV2CCN4_9ROSI
MFPIHCAISWKFRKRKHRRGDCRNAEKQRNRKGSIAAKGGGKETSGQRQIESFAEDDVTTRGTLHPLSAAKVYARVAESHVDIDRQGRAGATPSKLVVASYVTMGSKKKMATSRESWPESGTAREAPLPPATPLMAKSVWREELETTCDDAGAGSRCQGVRTAFRTPLGRSTSE